MFFRANSARNYSFEKVMLNKKQFMNFKLHNNSIIDPIDLKFDSYIAPVELENTNKIKNEDVNTDISSDLSFAIYMCIPNFLFYKLQLI